MHSTLYTELSGGPLHGHHWDGPAHPMGPARVLELRVPEQANGLTDPIEAVTSVQYATYRLAPDEGGASRAYYRYEAPITILPSRLPR